MLGVSWGRLSTEGQHEWGRLHCDRTLTGKSHGGFKRHPNATEYSNYWLKAYSRGAQNDNRSFFMNWGYAPVYDPRCKALPRPGNAGGTGCQMYAHLMKRAMRPLLGHEPPDLESALIGKQSLEVGCGRGAGSRFVAEHLKPTRHTGLDLVEGQLQISRAATAHLGTFTVTG